jgi:hypothetical protein
MMSSINGTQYIDTQHKDTQHIVLIYFAQDNDIQCNDTHTA